MLSLLSVLLMVPIVYCHLTDFKSDVRYNATYIKNDILSHVSHLFPSIHTDVMSHSTQAEKYQLKPIRATLALLSQRQTPFFSWIDAKYALSINRLNYCTYDQIRTFSCIDCKDLTLKIVHQSPSNHVRVIILTTERFILVGFHGTTKDIKGWMSELTTTKMDFPCSKCQVNQDFYHKFSEVVDPVMDALTEVHEQEPTLPIYVTGHSSGAALATLFAVQVTIVSPSLPITHVFTFGSPRVGNLAFATFANTILGERWFRVMNQLDVVPSIPPQSFGYHHTGQLMLCNTGSTVCVIKGRNDENEGGIQDDFVRLSENIQDCHFTYWKETLKCNSK